MTDNNPTLLQKFFGALLGKKNKNNELATLSETEQALIATTNLLRLIELAMSDNKYIKTEGMLRLNANEVRKNKAMSDIDSFFDSYQQEEDDHALLGSLIKTYFKNSLTNDDKIQIVTNMGLALNDIEIAYLPKQKMEALTVELKQSPIKFINELPSLSHFIYFCQFIAASAEINKMTPNNIAACIATTLLPNFGSKATLAFEKNISILLQIIVESWIKEAETGLADVYANKIIVLPDDVATTSE